MGKVSSVPSRGRTSYARGAPFWSSPFILFGRLLGERRAAAAIEFALALPFMTLLLVGAFDYGNLAYTMMEVSQAAHAGAFYAYQAAVTGGACTAGGIIVAETSSTSLGNAISTTAPANPQNLTTPVYAAPTCAYSGCPGSGSISGVIAATGSTCTIGSNTDVPGTYAVAYASTSFTPLLPFTSLAFPSKLSALAVIRYK